jgi:hypothetical protein
VSPEQLAAIKSNKTDTDFVTATCKNLQDEEAKNKFIDFLTDKIWCTL